ncbi:MAG TPA: hypothetical protein H9822_09400 [Candidatus Yaniella excrementavium]|nr:hypothetical protein [Candidatus Yaniella excrementavium]
MAKRYVNTRGWWGIFLHATWPTLLVTVLTGLVFQIVISSQAGLSALTAGIVVWMLSAVSVVLIASIWKNHRNLAIPVAMGAFVAKMVFLGFLLTVVPPPDWFHTTGAALGALVAIIVWQVAEVIVFINTRRLIYP